MNYADIKTVDIQDGTGIRVSIYVSGCHFHCKGCHNKEAWDFNYGKKFDETTINYIINAMDHEYISGLSILGGEPMELANQQALVGLVKKVKEIYPQKTIWCYTGYKFKEDLLEKMYKEYSYTKELLNNIDIIVDGEFIEEKKLVDLKFRGSTNQKKIDVKASLKTGRIVELKFGDEERYENIEKKQENSKVLIFKEFKIDEKSSSKKKEPVYINVDNSAYFDSQQETTLTYQIQEMKEKVVAEKARHA